MRTTIILQDDIHAKLGELFSKRGTTTALNAFATEHLFTKKKPKSMFGTLKRFDLSDVKIPDEEFN